jgi:hypothetical protein
VGKSPPRGTGGRLEPGAGTGSTEVDRTLGVESMLKDIVSANPLDNYRLQIAFEDGISGIVDLKTLVSFHGIFAPLEDRKYFNQVRVDLELGTVTWPNGADLDPDVLYERLAPQNDLFASK